MPLTPTPTNPMRRLSDNDKVVKIGDEVEKWFKLIWPILVAIFVWYAHDIREPIKQIPGLERSISEIQVRQAQAAVIDSVSIEERKELRQGLLIIVRMLCLRDHADVRCQDIPFPTLPRTR